MDQELLGAIDSAYHRLEEKQAKLLRVLSSLTLPLDVGWYNGHYHRDENGTWCREAYPIPVIGVRGLCDIELQFRQISVSTKRGRDSVLSYSFEKFTGYTFEAYGVEQYLTDFCRPGQAVQELKKNVLACDEREIGFSFLFPFDADSKEIFALIDLLQREGFYD